MCDFLKLLPPDEDAGAAKFYPAEFFDDKDAALELMTRRNKSEAEEFYCSCSGCLQSLDGIEQLIDPQIKK